MTRKEDLESIPKDVLAAPQVGYGLASENLGDLLGSAATLLVFLRHLG